MSKHIENEEKLIPVAYKLSKGNKQRMEDLKQQAGIQTWNDTFKCLLDKFDDSQKANDCKPEPIKKETNNYNYLIVAAAIAVCVFLFWKFQKVKPN